MTDLDNGADLRERFDRAMNDVSAPEHLTAGVLNDGRRLRRRRRLLTGAGGVATAAAVAAFVVAGLGSGSPSTVPGFATQPQAPKSSEKPITGLPSLAPEGPNGLLPEPPAGWWDAPADRLLQQLKAALPDGVEVTEHDPGNGSLGATLDAPAGPGGFQMILYPPDLDEDLIPEGPVTYTDSEGTEHTMIVANGVANARRIKCGQQANYTDACEEILNGDGVAIGRLTSFLQDDTITFYEATFLGPDGGMVYLTVWNATDEKPGLDTPASATVPPLTLEQLRELVQDPVWTSYQP